MHAQLHGPCSRCPGVIAPGQYIERDPEGGWAHVECPPSREERDAEREVCTVCWLLKPCACE